MKLVIFILIVTLVYALRMRYLLAERKVYSKEELKVLQSTPLLLATTFFYVVVVAKTILLSIHGFLPLLQ